MIPGPRGWEAVKTIMDLRRDPLGALIRLQRAYGDILVFRYGPIRRVVLFDPASVQRILQDNHTNYNKDSPFYHMLGWFLGQGLVTSDGELWRQQRRLIQPAFHKSRVEALIPKIQAETKKMISNFRPGEIIDVAAAMIELTLRIIGLALFSEPLGACDEGIGSALDEIQRQMQSRFRSFYPLPPRFPTLRDRRFRQANTRLRSLVLQKIKRPRGDDILGALPDMAEGQLVDELVTLMLAGHETVATTLAWALALLSRHPGQQDNDMRRVVLETLRLYPSIGVLGRRAIGPDRLAGHAIAAGQIVSTAPYVLHRHPGYWDNPEGFDPDRFLEEPVKGSFIPFAAGPRQCIGNHLAMIEAITVLDCLREVRLELIPGQKLEIDPQVTLRPKGGLWMRVRKR
ncbi:MAG: cytochrome P450 [Vulcanimicrobiota bacterium]